MSRKQFIYIHIVHHPVESGNVTVVEIPYLRQSLADIKHQVMSNQEVTAVLDGGKEINPDDWSKTLVSAGAKVVFGPVVGWPALFGFTTWGAFLWAAAINIAWMVGISYLGGLLFNQDLKQPKEMDRDGGQSFAWNPQTTQQEGIPRPVCYGTNMHYGNVVARWTDVDESGNELLYMILDYGRGPIQGKGVNIVYFNDQPSGNYPGISIQERLGTLNQTCMTGFEKNKLEYRPAAEISYDGGALTWITPNNFFDDIEYTLEFPQGLYHYQKDGSRVAHGVGVKVEISVRGAESWTTLMNTTISENQLAPVYKAYKASEQGFNCVYGTQYDLKITKTSEDVDDGRTGDKMYLRSVREVVNIAFTRPGRALLGITALATERLSGHINVKWVADDKLVQVYNGTVWSIAFSQNRAWVALDELTQPVISGDGNGVPFVIERYEGLDPSRIDLALFYEWAEWCSQQVSDGDGGTEDRMTCNTIVDYQTDVWSLAYELSQIGRMYPYWQGNILTGWVDKAVDDVIDLVTFDNIMVRSWKNSWAGYGDMAGGVTIFYKDALHGYERKTLPIPNENAGLYTRNISIEGIGVTGHALAARVANHALTRNEKIKNVNSVRMYKDALRYRIGQVVRLQANVPDWGATYRVIESEANNTVKLDRVCTATAGDIIYIRSYDETNEVVVVDSYTVDSVADTVITITETWGVKPIKNNILAVGIAGKIKLRRIIEMRHTVNNYFDVKFETYDTTLFDSDSIEPSIDNPDYVWPAPASDLTKPITKWEVVDLINQMLPPQPDIEIPWISNCNWTGNDVDTVTWAKRDATEPILFRYRGTTYEITPDNTTDEFIYWDPNFTTQFKTTNVASVALAAGMWMVCTNKDGVAHSATPFQLTHAAILLAHTIRAEQYLELRNTYVYNGDDSLDNAKPFTVPFKIVSEMTAIVTAKLSFRILPYRAYSTGAASGGGSAISSGTWGGNTGGSSGTTGYEGTGQTGSGSVSGTTGASGATGASVQSTYVSSVPSSHGHSFSGGSHSHSFSGGSHTHSGPSHAHSIGSHTHTIENHQHGVTLPNHVHEITYGLHEESNSPTVHFHIDNGAGFGGASANYNSDQLDIDISGSLSGTGWKNLRFDTDLRCRIFAIIELKLDLTA